jgi:hypothetical protein
MRTLKHRIENGKIVITQLRYNRYTRSFFVAGKFFEFLGLKVGDVLIRRVVGDGWWRLERFSADGVVGFVDYLKVGKYGPKGSNEGVIYIRRDLLEGVNLPKKAQVLFKVLDSEPNVVYMKFLVDNQIQISSGRVGAGLGDYDTKIKFIKG